MVYKGICSVNLILFTVLLVHLILHISPHHSHHLRSQHLSITSDLKLICSTNPFLRNLTGSIWTVFTDLELGVNLLGSGVCSYSFSVFGYVLD